MIFKWRRVLARDIGDVLCNVDVWPSKWYQLLKSLNS